MVVGLPLESVIGFDGKVLEGLIAHPDKETLIYPLGSNIVITKKDNFNDQQFLQGHTDEVSCLALSSTGKYLATGQITYMGFPADIIIWDLETLELKYRLQLHKVKIASLAFSCDEKYLASLGGQDDNSLVLWDVETGQAVCGSPTHPDFTLHVKFLNKSNTTLVTAGNYNCTVWRYDQPNNKIRPTEMHLGQLKRVFTSLSVEPKDEFVYCGTTTGDVLQVSLTKHLFKNSGPAKGLILQGVSVTNVHNSGDIWVGGKDGSVQIMRLPADTQNPKQLKKIGTISSTKLEGQITTIAFDHSSNQSNIRAFVGTAESNIYLVDFDTKTKVITKELLQTNNYSKINSIAFPRDYSEVFLTCGLGSIRCWHLETNRELIRILVPNLECHCVSYSQDGKAILSGWCDGKIRAFGPQSGKLLYQIHNAHPKAVTAIACTSNSNIVISGGEEGMVQVWEATSGKQVMLASMKEHKGPVNAIDVHEGTETSEFVTASSDGSCIVWDLTTFKRRTSIFANTFFKSIAYHPDGSQIVTAGTDRKIAYWDSYDGQAIRVIEGSKDLSLNTLSVDVQGRALVVGGADKLVKVWGYDEGRCYQVGVGHSGEVTKVLVSPDMKHIVSAGSEGAIFIWKYADLPQLESND